MINGMHPGMSFDLAKLASREQQIRFAKEALIAEANQGGERQFGVIRSIRANLGGAIVTIGQRVRGERRENPAETAPSVTTLRMAR